MIRLQATILSRSRVSLVSVVVTALAVAFAFLLLLLTTVFPSALSSRDGRVAWRALPVTNAADASVADAFWKITEDRFLGTPITRVDVASVSSRAPLSAGIERVPGPGEIWLSPGLQRAIESAGQSQLGDRYNYRNVGTISDEGLAFPDELVAIVGHTPENAKALGATGVVAGEIGPRRQASSILLVASGLIALAVVVPLILLIASATRLDAAARENRYASLRLAGASTAQVSRGILAQASLGGLVGTGAGLLAYPLVRELVAHIPLLGSEFFPSDFAHMPASVAAVGLVSMAAAVLGSLVGLRRLAITPLGVYRRHSARKPTTLKLIPLAVGIPLFALATGFAFGGSLSNAAAVSVVAASFLIVVLGLLSIGSWTTFYLGRTLVGRARSPSSLIAARRLTGNAGEHAAVVSGVTLAALAVGLFYGMVPGLESQVSESPRAGLRPNVVRADLPAVRGVANVGPRLLEEVGTIPGVVLSVGSTTVLATDESGQDYVGLVGDCASLASVLEIEPVTSCGESTLALNSDVRTGPVGWLEVLGPASDSSQEGGQTGLIAPIPASAPRFSSDRKQLTIDFIAPPETILERGTGFFTEEIYVALADDSLIETVRTQILRLVPTATVFTAEEAAAAAVRPLKAARGPVDAAALVVLFAGGLSAAIAGAGRMLNQSRELSELRLIGIPLSTIRRSYLIETSTPIVSVTLTAGIVGVVVAWLLLVLGGVSLGQAVDPRGIAVLTIAAVVGVLVAASPVLLLGRITIADDAHLRDRISRQRPPQSD